MPSRLCRGKDQKKLLFILFQISRLAAWHCLAGSIFSRELRVERGFPRVSSLMIKKTTASSVEFQCSCNSTPGKYFGSHWADFNDILCFRFCENVSRNINFDQNLSRITGTCMVISRWTVLGMRDIADRCGLEILYLSFRASQVYNVQ